MPASITIQSGVSAGTTFWIERPVIRIGSDPSADICLLAADVAAHAITVEFRDGVYRLHNRSGATVALGSAQLPSEQSSDWVPGNVLNPGGDIELLLAVEQDPAPGPAPAGYQDQGDKDDGPVILSDDTATVEDEESKAKKRQTNMQIMVIILCVLGSVLMLAFKPNGTTKAKTPAVSFSSLIDTSLESDTTSRKLVQHLQFAQAAVVRGDLRSAKRRFSEIRDRLVKQFNQSDVQEDETRRAILKFVELQLLHLK